MDKNKIYNFDFEKHCNKNEFLKAFEKSTPRLATGINISNIDSNFNSGDFIFTIKKISGVEFKLPFYNGEWNINDFWKFLETLCHTKKPIILNMFHSGINYIIYSEPLGQDVRFILMDTEKLASKLKTSTFMKYNFSDSTINLDILIRKRILIKTFYNALFEIFKNYENIALFEPPLVTFSFWIKDSEIIKKFIRGKKYKEVISC